MIDQWLDYLHNNPAKSELVENSENYIFNSAKDYCGCNGQLNIVIME